MAKYRKHYADSLRDIDDDDYAGDFDELSREEITGELVSFLENDMEDAGYMPVTDMMDIYDWRHRHLMRSLKEAACNAL